MHWVWCSADSANRSSAACSSSVLWLLWARWIFIWYILHFYHDRGAAFVQLTRYFHTYIPAFLAGVKCTVFYSAPKRSKLVSKLCSEDVCQCAESRPLLFRPLLKNSWERPNLASSVPLFCFFVFSLGPCHKMKNAFKSRRGQRITKEDRMQHACFFPTVDYGQYCTRDRVLESYLAVKNLFFHCTKMRQ